MAEPFKDILTFEVAELVFKRGETVDHVLTEIAALPSDSEFESYIRLLRMGRFFHRLNGESRPLD
jgi:hypothetical protein